MRAARRGIGGGQGRARYVPTRSTSTPSTNEKYRGVMKYVHHPQPVWLNVLHHKVLHQAHYRHCINRTVSAMSRLTADVLQEQYGEELARPPLTDAKTPRMLMKAFLERIPPVVTTDGIGQFYWDNTHRTVYKEGLAAPHDIHRMQSIRWIWRDTPRPKGAGLAAPRTRSTKYARTAARIVPARPARRSTARMGVMVSSRRGSRNIVSRPAPFVSPAPQNWRRSMETK